MKVFWNDGLKTLIGNISVINCIFAVSPPFDRTELIKFRKRIGEEGSEQILKRTVQLFPKKETQEKEVLIDTTVQGKNIPFPTDVKLQKRIVENSIKIVKKKGLNCVKPIGVN